MTGCSLGVGPDIFLQLTSLRASFVAQLVNNPSPVQKMWVQSLGWEDAMKEEMTTNSSTFAWKIPVTEVSGGLQSKGSLRVGHD